jgi:ClpP class serine protease
MDRFPHLASRLFNVPLAVLPDKAEVAMAALADRLGIAHLFRADGGAVVLAGNDAMKAFGGDVAPSASRGYDVVAGVAVIEVEGLLVQKLGTMRPYCGMTGYDGIRSNLLEALADPEVRAIVLDIDSGGGEVAGCFDLADTIYAARGVKPLRAICSEVAYSAAYAIASACDNIAVPRTGGVGSVGVITMLVDMSRALAAGGVAVHFIHYGDQKAEAGRAQVTGVSKDMLARLQASVDRVGELFVATVARNRGISAAAVRATKAACFEGELGVAAGLADAVASPDEAFSALLADLDAA